MTAITLVFARAIKNLAQYSLYLSFLFLIGCLDFDFSDSDDAESLPNAYSDTKIEGMAVNSVIENGIVRSYQIAHSEDGSSTSTTPFGLPIRTDKNGSFSFNLPNDIQTDSILIKITADETTKMTCDVVSGCATKVSDDKVSFGNTFLLDDSFEITAIIPTLDQGFINTVTINALTHLASTRANSQDSGPTIENINTSYRYIENLFGFDTRALQLPTPDLTKLDSQTETSKSAMKVSVLSASFLALLNSPDWESISEIINHASNRISSSGTIAAANMGALPEVSLDDLFYHAGEATQGLISQTQNSDNKNTLNKISLEVNASYELTMIASEIISTIEIETHPISIVAKEGLSASFLVTALGDDLSYQWRLNNSPINGANDATYIINKTTIENTGVYDVIVSNQLGSQSSLSALLTVIPADTHAEIPTDTNTESPTNTDTETPTDNGTETSTDNNSEAPTNTGTETPTNNGTDTPTNTETEAPIENIPTQNVPPIAQDDSIEIFEDTSKAIYVLINDSDVDNDALTITHASITNGSGQVAIQNIISDQGNASSVLFFTPEMHSNNPSTVSYTISDGHDHHSTAHVNIQIIPINDTPESFPDFAEMNEDTTVTLDVLANDFDADNDTLTVSTASSALGTVEINSDNTLTFTVQSDFTGIAEVNYITLDGHGGITAGIATITVINVNDPPVAVADNAETIEDTAITIDVLSNDSDKDLDELKVVLASSPQGQVSINPDNTLTFTPNENINGSAVLSYTISDDKGGSTTANVNVSILAVNDSPDLSNDFAHTKEDIPVIINLLNNDSDADNDTLTITDVHTTNPGGMVSLNKDNTVTFVPVSNFNGEVNLSYTVNDGHNGVANASVTVIVDPINDLPILADHQISTEQATDITINALEGAYDEDGDSLNIIALTALNGKVSLDDTQSITYQPASDFSGEDTISYTVSDGNGGVSNAIVTVFVSAVEKSYTIELNWERPTKRDNDTLLNATDIKGYMIEHGENFNQLTASVFINGAFSTDYAFHDLSSGIYYFAIATVTQDDVQGNFSEVVAVPINQ